MQVGLVRCVLVGTRVGWGEEAKLFLAGQPLAPSLMELSVCVVIITIIIIWFLKCQFLDHSDLLSKICKNHTLNPIFFHPASPNPSIPCSQGLLLVHL